MSKKRISDQQRRHQDYLRRKGLAVGQVYMARLVKLRRKEVKRCLDICANYNDFGVWSRVIENNLNESAYLYDWQTGLYLNAGLEHAQSVQRDLTKTKADAVSGVWETELRNFAAQRCGRNIVSVSGTLLNDLQKILANAINEDVNIGIEKMTKRVLRDFAPLNEWQARRIAQTETMIGLAASGDMAARSCDVPFLKEWCISGVGNTRESHAEMDGVTVDQDEYFKLTNSDGTTCMMLYPHDTSSNAPAEQIINCACSCIRVPKEAPLAEDGAASAEEDPAQEERIKELMKELPTDIAEADKRAIAKNEIELEKALKVKKGKPMSTEEADESHANPLLRTSRSYRVNCQTCSPAYVLRTRGFDVTAGPNSKREGNLSYYLSKSSHIWEKWKNADGTAAKHTSFISWRNAQKLTKMTPDDYLKFYEEHTKATGIYEVVLSWDGGGGHSTLLQRFADGSLQRVDAQVWSHEKLTVADDICKHARAQTPYSCDGIMRIDDKLFDTKFAKIFRKAKK